MGKDHGFDFEDHFGDDIIESSSDPENGFQNKINNNNCDYDNKDAVIF